MKHLTEEASSDEIETEGEIEVREGFDPEEEASPDEIATEGEIEALDGSDPEEEASSDEIATEEEAEVTEGSNVEEDINRRGKKGISTDQMYYHKRPTIDVIEEETEDLAESGFSKPICNDLFCPDDSVYCSTKFESIPPDFMQTTMVSECLSENHDVLIAVESIVPSINPGHYLKTSDVLPIYYNTLDVNFGDL